MIVPPIRAAAVAALRQQAGSASQDGVADLQALRQAFVQADRLLGESGVALGLFVFAQRQVRQEQRQEAEHQRQEHRQVAVGGKRGDGSA